MNPTENLTGLISVLYKKRKLIILLTIICTFLAAGLSLLLPNYYEAETIFYAASPDLAKPSPLGTSSNRLRYYGESEDVDRLLSIANSSELLQELVDSFGLYKHYEIDPAQNLATFKVRKKIGKAMSIEKTKYDAIRIAVEDLDPFFAREMTNFARNRINKKAQKLVKNSQKTLLATFEANISNKEKSLNELNTELDQARKKYNIFDTRIQGQTLSNLLTTAQSNLANIKARKRAYQSINQDSTRKLNILSAGLQQQIKAIQNNIKNYNSGLSTVKTLEDQQGEAIDQLGIDKERYKLLQAAFNNDFDAVHIVERAEKPLNKSRPRRSILVIGACLASFLLSTIAVLVAAYYKRINWKEITQ